MDLSVGGAVGNSNGTVSAVGALDANGAGALNNTSGKLFGNERRRLGQINPPV
ncbi:hypothetical protein [Variovorax paradoxus]|uniref:hypothetical protein n=1 Tax=Variovorax paradoxus TaxID=34073 RepID=UPI000AF1890C